MCGIAGRVNVERPVSPTQLDAMSELIANRGPDGEGAFVEGRAGLAHRRLAIVDLAGGQQPVFGAGGRVVMVYNGEVYNHADLRPELEAHGHQFETRCDTEAVLRAHEQWGEAAPGRLRGMFAYAAWDRRARTLTLVRDRLGIKPLYYAHLPSGDLLFASELKSLLVEPEVDRGIDEDALACYLSLRWVPSPLTMLRGVRKLEPGCTLTWKDGAITIARYWAGPPAQAERPVPPTYVEGAGRLTELLDEVVGAWRMGDVPLGSFLSGGLDSTLVTAILARMARAAGDPTPCTFSVGYVGKGVEAYDELSPARMAAAALGTRHREIAITGEQVAAAVPSIAWSLDEPLGDSACIPLWFVARRAREEVTIVLSGEGADEVFGGYSIYGKLLAARRMRETIPGLGGLAGLGARALPSGRLRRACQLASRPYYGVSRAFDDERGPAVDRALAPMCARARGAATPLGQLLAFDRQGWLADDLLLKADRMTMAHALELRPPLLDHRLMEEVSTWPDAWKVDPRGGAQKKILRLAAEGLVPKAVLDRPKLGFGTPIGPWLRGALRPMAQDLLLGSRSLSAARTGRKAIEGLLVEHDRGQDRSAELWSLLALELFMDQVARGIPVTPATLPHLAPTSAAGSALEVAV